MKKTVLIILAVLGLGLLGWWLSLDKDERAVLANMPTDTNVLFWSVEERDAAFRALDAFPALAEARVIAAGDTVLELPEGEALNIAGIDSYMEEQRTSALVILLDGKIVTEKYGLDFDAEGKWTSFSVAKGLTSTLVGAAVKDGAIESLDDPITKYIKGLEGSAYEEVSVEQLLTMTSGVAWNEDYTDPNSDVARFINHTAEEGVDVTVSYMRELPREAPAGEKWVYKTGETNLIGVLVSEATGKPLADYLSEKIWAPTLWDAAGCNLAARLDRIRDQRLLHSGGDARYGALWPIYHGWSRDWRRSCAGRWVAGGGDDGTRADWRSRPGLWLPMVDLW